MRLDDVNVTSPKGVSVALQNAHTGKYRSSFDLNLTEPGTYRIYTASNGLLAQWLSDDGQRRRWPGRDRKSTRLNSSHVAISYAVFCLKKKTKERQQRRTV